MGGVMTSELRRALSPAERWYWIADQVSPLNVVARVHLHGNITWGLLKRAAAALVAEHPLLRVAITSDADGTNPAFVPSQSACPIRRVHGDELEWERQADEHELATSLNWRRGPLVRIVDIKLDSCADSGQEEHDLMLTASHIIADGTTALALLQRLIEHADHLAAVGDTGYLVASRPAIGAPEDLLPERYRGPQGVPRIAVAGLADLLAGALGARPRRLLPEVAVRPSLRKTRLVHRKLGAIQLESLTRRCRQEGVTVHGALAAAMAMVIGPAGGQRGSGRMCIGSPIDFRAELTPPVSSDEAGAYVCTVPSIVRFGPGRDPQDLWSIARQVNRSLRRRKRMGQHFALLSALRFMSPASVAKSAKTFRLLERFGPGNVCISNLGRYGFAERIGDWQLSGAQFVAGVSVSGYLAATVNTSHGELFWNFNYIESAVSQRSAQRYADDCIQTLLDAIGETNEKKVCNDQVSSDHRRVERVGEGRRYSPG
jgi:hypothetical protein